MKPMSKQRRNPGIYAAAVMLCALSAAAPAQTAPYAPPQSPRAKLNFDLNWKFVREDVPGAEPPGFDDTAWTTVSTPHCFNDIDSFRQIISHSGGDRGTYKGLAWYRKHFKFPARFAGHKIFLEFEGVRQAGEIFLNGKLAGLYENGVTAYGLDITGAVHFGNEENVLAVKVDNRTTYAERSSDTPFQWNANDFNPDHGGALRCWTPISRRSLTSIRASRCSVTASAGGAGAGDATGPGNAGRSEERRVAKEWRSRGWRDDEKKP